MITGDGSSKQRIAQNPESGDTGVQQNVQPKEDDISSFTDEAEEKGQLANAAGANSNAQKSSQPTPAAKVS